MLERRRWNSSISIPEQSHKSQVTPGTGVNGTAHVAPLDISAIANTSNSILHQSDLESNEHLVASNLEKRTEDASAYLDSRKRALERLVQRRRSYIEEDAARNVEALNQDRAFRLQWREGIKNRRRVELQVRRFKTVHCLLLFFYFDSFIILIF